MPHTDPVLAALDAVEAALERTAAHAELIRDRAQLLRRRRNDGDAWSAIVTEEEPPLIVQLLTQSTDALHASGGRLRRVEARALHEEGMTMDAIARHFGVTRQRVSALLRPDAADEPPAG